MVSKQLKAKVLAAVKRAVQKNARRMFTLSQNTTAGFVPVDTGFLRSSGALQITSKGAIIVYTAPYAADVEYGIETDRPIKGEQRVQVEAYTTKKGIKVAAHEVVYKDKKVIKLKSKASKGDAIFRVISVEKARPGQFFLKRATTESLKTLREDIIEELKSLGTVVPG